MQNVVFIIFILGSGGLGLIREDFMAIPTPVGLLPFNVILLLLTYVIILLDKKRQIINFQHPVLKIYSYIIILILIQAIRNLFIDGMELKILFRGFRGVYMIFFTYPLIIYVNTEKRLEKFIKIIIYMGVLASLISLLQYFSIINLLSETSTSEFEGINRIVNPSVYVTVLSILFSIAILFVTKSRRKYFYLTIVLFGMLSTVISLTRNLIGAIVITLLLMMVLNSILTHKVSSFFKSTILVGFSLLIVFFVFSDINILQNRIDIGLQEIKSNQGNFGIRQQMLANSFIQIWNKFPILGKGFNYTYSGNYFDAFTLNGDANYNNILVLFGYAGLVMFGFLYYKISKFSIVLYKKLSNTYYKAISLVLICLPVFFLITGFFSSYMRSTGLTIITTTISLTYILDQISKKKIRDNKISIKY